jgi:hypothetical protein
MIFRRDGVCIKCKQTAPAERPDALIRATVLFSDDECKTWYPMEHSDVPEEVSDPMVMAALLKGVVCSIKELPDVYWAALTEEQVNERFSKIQQIEHKPQSSGA